MLTPAIPLKVLDQETSTAGYVLQEVLTLDVCWGEAEGREASQEAAAGIRRGPGLDCVGWRGRAGRAGLERKRHFIHLEGMISRTWWPPGYD